MVGDEYSTEGIVVEVAGVAGGGGDRVVGEGNREGGGRFHT